MHLILRLICQFIDSELCLESKLLLSGGVTNGPRPITYDVVTVPCVCVHIGCALTQLLKRNVACVYCLNHDKLNACETASAVS